MRKALIEATPYKANKHNVIQIGAMSYDTNNNTLEVDLTDWPLLDGERALKSDVYYTPVQEDGKHFVCKYNDVPKKKEQQKLKKIRRIRDQFLDPTITGWVHSRQFGQMQAIALNVPGATLTMSENEYKDFLIWSGKMETLTDDLPALKAAIEYIDIKDIHIGNTDIFPVMPDLKRPNGG